MRSRIILLFMLILTLQVDAQEVNTSVYSRFGLGDIHPNSNVAQRGMSGLTYGVTSPLTININNPASLSFISQPSFAFGVRYDNVTASNGVETQKNTYTQFDHFMLAFPISKHRGGIALGVVPYSSLGYEYSDTMSIQGVENGLSKQIYGGRGGINTFFLKSGYRFITHKDTTNKEKHYKQDDFLSLGLGFKYYFGSLTNSKKNEFDRSLGFVNTMIANQTTYNDVGLDYSMLYKTYLMRRKEPKDDKLTLNIGLSYTPSLKLSGTRRTDAFTYQTDVAGNMNVIDSVSSVQNQKGFAILPSGFGAGFTFDYDFYPDSADNSNNHNLLFGMDYTINNWSEFELNFSDINSFSEITNSSKMVFGLQYRPNTQLSSGKVDNYFQACTYRIGYRSSLLNIEVDDKQIKEYGINLGISLPLIYNLHSKKSDSHIDLSMGYGETGTTDNGLIKENYLRFMVGISLHPVFNDRWFDKRKYD